ncbi:aminopeptidase [Flavivirga aquatica]|uniref:Aminopeptidase n=1 Tax=Flavivirga aquatica TaxID=1849968 RepID=A0A1E5SJV3_9FLAO|nr:M1 family metallopeptidase [Flavivirga aquatica]OEJ99336.1 aminopeptidase [Flavivirga aquatica]
MRFFLYLFLTLFSSSILNAQNQPWQGKFEPIDRIIAPPNIYRTASGAPGKAYWQQRANYKIKATLDEKNNTLTGEETITYFNNSPDNLSYLWIQLEQNVNKKENEDFGAVNNRIKDSITTRQMQFLTRPIDFPAGYTIKYVKDNDGKAIKTMVNNTMMKVKLNTVLKSGESTNISIAWSYPITDRSLFLLSREGYEYFPEDDNTVYLIAHWFPRMAVYNDTEGWQNQQFHKLGEFALEFGDYEVEITVPENHIVASTGLLQNSESVLTKTQRKRMDKAKKSFDKPIMIITKKEAEFNEKEKSSKQKTWKFSAKNVRDFAFASSRKFMWDAQAVKLPTNTVMAMSFYPKEGLPVWQGESTKAIVHALEVYSEATFDYPYPVAISVNTSNIGMEFPMISFNGGRPKNGKISDAAKASMIGTIIHEVGHNWFPMIVSSDERKWMWMDEGLNTFLHHRTLAERYPNFNSVTPKSIVPFMSGDKNILRPIMTTSDNELLSQFGANFYLKPTVGLQMLRNSIIGKELFDDAFKEYANRWKYKHPNPADLFRTIEDATATNLDWFYRGWFFTTDHVDMELNNVKWFQVHEENINIEDQQKARKLKIESNNNNNELAKDFSSGPEVITMTSTPDASYGQFLSRLNEPEIRKQLSGKNIYEVTIKNVGGLVMPITIEWIFTDGTTEIDRLPAEIWRRNEYETQQTFIKNKEVSKINLDPNFEFADTNVKNNSFPKTKAKSGFDVFKTKKAKN